ncbi:MAG: hypothetical protein LBS54_01940 [Dysgonamonadaceae bacterium]|jgi:hypothetical protein|nr:hypothetical protein [Dysgonamonadaceae bacterium]
MDNLKEYLPLLVILLISLISQAFKPKKKKPDTETAPQAEKTEHDAWFDVPRVEVKKPMSQPKIHRPVTHPKPKKSSYAEIKEATATAKRQATVVLSDEDTSPPFLNISDTDEIKKAIIYSEIFRRPE